MPKLLIVDDEPLIRKGICKMLERIAPEWTDCAEAQNGQEALRIIQQNKVDLIFTDIRMPVMDGLDMQERLNEQGYRIPIVFLTGFDEFQYVQRALRGRAYDFLLKPVHDDDILRVLKTFRHQFTAADKRIEHVVANKLQQFEFELLNALESLDVNHCQKTILHYREEIETPLSSPLFIKEVIRIASGFFIKKGINGYDWYSMLVGDYADLDTIMHVMKLQLISVAVEKPGTHAERIIRQAKQYVRQHCEQPLTLEDVARTVHLNTNYFSELFRAHTGETFTQYVKRVRVEKVKQLLLDREVKIYEIAERMGYANPRYFSKVFKEQVGMTPKQYRERNQFS